MVEEVVQRVAAMTMVTRGEVSDDSRAYADKQISKLVEHIVEPVLFARVKLTQAPDPASATAGHRRSHRGHQW